MARDPIKHHFIPSFFLKGWADETGYICQFSRPDGKTVKPKRKHANATGYEENLYSIEGPDGEKRDYLEKNFFKDIDNKAAVAIQSIDQLQNKDHPLRNYWSIFLLSLELRTPRDVHKAKEIIKGAYQKVSEELQYEYDVIRSASDPKSVLEWLDFDNTFKRDKDSLDFLATACLGPKTISHICKMIWSVVKIEDSHFPLLTSDHPIIKTDGLAHERSYLLIPLSPNSYFLATNNRLTMKEITGLPGRKISRKMNEKSVSNAREYVFCDNDHQRKFIERRFGSNPEVRLLDSVGVEAAATRTAKRTSKYLQWSRQLDH